MLWQSEITWKSQIKTHHQAAQTTKIVPTLYFDVLTMKTKIKCYWEGQAEPLLSHLRVYMTLPLLHSLSRRLGVVIQWASDLREFRKNVSGIQILPTMLLLSISSFMELLNLSRLSYHVWAKKMSMVYSCKDQPFVYCEPQGLRRTVEPPQLGHLDRFPIWDQ